MFKPNRYSSDQSHNEYGVNNYIRRKFGDHKISDDACLSWVFDFCLENKKFTEKIHLYDEVPKHKKTYVRENCYKFVQDNFKIFTKFFNDRYL